MHEWVAGELKAFRPLMETHGAPVFGRNKGSCVLYILMFVPTVQVRAASWALWLLTTKKDWTS